MEFTREEKIMLANSNIAVHECEFGDRDEFEKDLLRKLHLGEINSKEYRKGLYDYYYSIGRINEDGYKKLLQTL